MFSQLLSNYHKKVDKTTSKNWNTPELEPFVAGALFCEHAAHSPANGPHE